MSFASEMKHQITLNTFTSAQNKACLCALFLCRASIHMNWQGMYLSFQTEHASTAKFVYKIIKQEYQVDPRLSVIKKMRLKKNNIYRIQIYEKAQEILEDLSILTGSGLHDVPSYQMTRSEKNAKAFLAGAFLGAGSINHPRSSNYHLEFSVEHEKLAELISKLLSRFYIPSKITTRKSHYVVYTKKGEKIADFIRLVNASDALFEFEDNRISRDFYNQITRLDNCELANEVKSMQASQAQLADIAVLEEHASQLQISDKIKRTMEIRKKFPEANISELCEEMLIAYGESISKSGMKHRLAKIREMAKPFNGEDK